jgi:protein-S-isoprenylcysteine O-methyltransferase Ste14
MPTIPRRLALALVPLAWLVAIPLGHGVVPWAISLLGPRYGWAGGRPAVWNLIGLAPLAAGAAVLMWVMVLGFSEASRLPERIALDWSPKLLLTTGPYAFSRHPMYLAELALWLGWVFLFGSPTVLLGFVALCAGVSMVARREERTLEAIFGGEYREYEARVPRWLGRPVGLTLPVPGKTHVDPRGGRPRSP